MTKPLVASLAVQQSGPLGKRRAAHLLRRCSFHISKARVDQLATMTADAAVDLLFDSPTPAPYLPRPLYWRLPSNGGNASDWIPNDSNYQESLRRRAVTAWWLRNAIFDDTAHHKVAFFLHTTFTTGMEGVSVSGSVNGQFQSLTRDVARFGYDHWQLMDWLTHSNAGAVTLKTVARKITLDNLMLCYLNNRQNLAPVINENYGREFLELFTIGIGDPLNPNYTEADVTKASEVFSGFSTKVRRNSSDIDPDTGIPKGTAYPNLHIAGDKAFSSSFTSNNPVLGETVPTEAGMYAEMDQFIDMVFDRTETAENYATKMYRFFFAIQLDTMFIQDVANDLMANGYDYIATLKTMLKSAHFYAICDPNPDASGGNIIKSPFEMVSEAYSFFQGDLPVFADINNPTNSELDDHTFRFPHLFMHTYYGVITGMRLLSPPNVAGYPPYYQEPDFDQQWYNPGSIPTRFGLGNRLVSQNEMGLGIPASLDAVAYGLYLETLGIDVSDSDAVLDETLCLFPQLVTPDRRAIFLDLFLGGEGALNWTIAWRCFRGQPLPTSPPGLTCDGNPGVGNPSAVRPHLNALVKAVIQAHEFQLK